MLFSSVPNYEINNHKLYKVENIKSYKYFMYESKVDIEFLSHTSPNIKTIYYIFDCPGESAFAHWIFESFIFVPIFIEISKIYPEIKILTTNTKKYVNNFFKLWNINNEIVYEIETKDNICFFPPIISLNDNNSDQEIFVKYINTYIDKINDMINPINLNLQSDLIFLPRNTEDNYINNNRIVPKTDLIEKKVIENGGLILNTYKINNILLQFLLVNSVNTIILDYGSSFLVNCIFLKNKKIKIIYGIRAFSYQTANCICMKTICDIIFNNNEISFDLNYA